MSINTPPNPRVDTFNNLYWIEADNNITQAAADLRYLKFPTAQGTENLLAISVNGPATINNQSLIITDGTTTNTVTKNGYTTKNTTADATHFLDFSDSSSTGIGAIQKTAGLSCNPSTNTISATAFSGNISLPPTFTTLTFSAGILSATLNSSNTFSFSTLSFATSQTITGIDFTNFRTNGVYRIILISLAGQTVTVGKSLTAGGVSNLVYSNWTANVSSTGVGSRVQLTIYFDGTSYHIEGFRVSIT
jgi:hypothetical protein